MAWQERIESTTQFSCLDKVDPSQDQKKPLYPKEIEGQKEKVSSSKEFKNSSDPVDGSKESKNSRDPVDGSREESKNSRDPVDGSKESKNSRDPLSSSKELNDTLDLSQSFKTIWKDIKLNLYGDQLEKKLTI